MTKYNNTAAIMTLGCKVNQYESEAISEAFTQYGIEMRSPDEVCDIYVINTCTVTSESERKCRQMIRRAINKNPKAYILVCGCLTQTDPDSIRSISGVDYICGNTNKLSVVSEAIRLLNGGEKAAQCDALLGDVFNCPFEDMFISRFERTRAYIKIEDGCESRCTYCIIPFARGKIRSKPACNVIKEIKTLVGANCREIVLTGIETGSYGKDLKDFGLADLLCEIDKICGECRIRTGSIDPSVMKKSFVDRIAELRSLAPHFHLSMQSGSDRILALMKRKYNTKTALGSINYLRERIPDVMFTTDIITGFPGETDEDFKLTKEFMCKARFLSAHIFPYSERKGTPAADMPDKIPMSIRHQRCTELIDLQKQITHSVIDEYIDAHRDKILYVLFETYKDGYAFGHTASFVEIKARSDVPLHSEIIPVIPLYREDERCVAEIV